MQETIVFAWIMLNTLTNETSEPQILETYFDSHVQCNMTMYNVYPRRLQLDYNEFSLMLNPEVLMLGGCYNAKQYEKRFGEKE